MPKGYVIARIDVSDAAEYAKYTAETPRLVAEAGGRFLTRGGRYEAKEGVARSRNVIIEFPDFETARGFYDSAGYQAILPHALKGAEREMVVVEGV
ncbi:MAG: DUF1330 domain-containing protein [Pseudomonadota bacterium]